jgi:hypothetical protein
VGGSRRVATEVDRSIFAEGFCFLAAPKRGERPHQRQSEPNFSLRLLVSQLSSSPAFLCKPLEHARHVHREKPVSMDFRRPNFMNFLRLSVGQMKIHMCRRSGNYQESQERAVRQIWTTVGTAIKIVRAVMTTFSQRVVAVCRSVAF